MLNIGSGELAPQNLECLLSVSTATKVCLEKKNIREMHFYGLNLSETKLNNNNNNNNWRELEKKKEKRKKKILTDTKIYLLCN